MADTLHLSADGASLDISTTGAEPIAWRVDGRDLLWSGDPEHWGFRAPILFPVVGASAGGAVTVGGLRHPMPQHGFARRAPFSVVADSASGARLRLTDTDETRGSYPFAFVLDVAFKLEHTSLSMVFEVTNTGEGAMPYALGFHPAFLWPFDAPDRSSHRVLFDENESDRVPEVAEGGLLARETRTVPLTGRELPLDPALFTEALVFLHVRGHGLAFTSPSGAAIRLDGTDFPHLAVWTKPTAPFLSLECWTGHADWADASGELAERASMRTLGPGESRRHAVTLTYMPAPS